MSDTAAPEVTQPASTVPASTVTPRRSLEPDTPAATAPTNLLDAHGEFFAARGVHLPRPGSALALEYETLVRLCASPEGLPPELAEKLQRARGPKSAEPVEDGWPTFNRPDSGRRSPAVAAHTLTGESARLEASRRAGAGVLIEFVRAVEPRDFCCFVFILAHGNLTGAAQALGMVRRTLDRQVKSWALRGPVYRRMLRLIPGRNLGGSPEVVSFGATAESRSPREESEPPQTVWERLGKTKAADAEQDYPGLLRDLHGALEGMNAGNWEAIQRELLAVLAEEICPTQ